MPMLSAITVSNAVLAAVLAALGSFLTADLLILPKYGNWPAVAADVVISGIIIMETSYAVQAPLSISGLIAVTAVLAAGEWYYHSYLRRMLFNRKR